MRADPARDVRDDVAEAGGVTEFDDKIWFHRTASAVIDPGRCVGCGACLAACPSASIGVAADGQPTLVRMCTGCSFCWDFCPLAGLRTERLAEQSNAGAPSPLGPLLGAYAARAVARAEAAQDGGVVTAIVEALLARGLADGALVTRRSGAFRGEPAIVTTADEVRDAAGSVYHQGFPLALLSKPLPPGVSSLAFVGTPCQISALRALQRSPWPYRRDAASAVGLTVGLFCTRSFDPPRLMAGLARRGVPLRDVERIDVRDGVLSVEVAGERLAVVPVRELSDAALRGCDECSDFTGRLADISVGNLGSDRGWTSVLVRTERGMQAWRASLDALEVRAIEDLAPLRAAEERNRRRAVRSAPERADGNGRLRTRYTEHLAAFDGTDRAPLVPPPHRSHHYQESC